MKKGMRKGGSFAILSSKKSSYSKIFDEFKIPYEELSKTELEN